MIKPLIEITLSMLLLLGIYQLLLAKTTLHRFKRFYLILCLVLPLSIPFLELEISRQEVFEIPSNEVVIDNVLSIIENKVAAAPTTVTTTPLPTDLKVSQGQKNNKGIPLTSFIIGLYALVTFLLLLRYGVSIRNILKRTKTAKRDRFRGISIMILNEATPPHNFLQLIFISQEDHENDTVRDRLLAHELSHAKEWHSLDILLVEFLRIIFWFNPLYIFCSRAIKNNHEYLADAAVVRQFADVSTYQKLLLGFAGQQLTGPRLASPSNYYLIKKRFIMMTKKTSKSAALLRLALLVPLVAIATIFFIVKVNTANAISTTELTTPSQKKTYPNPFTPDISPIDSDLYDFALRIAALGQENLLAADPYDTDPGAEYVALPETPVRTTASGTVVEVKQNDKRFGNFIRVKHDETNETLYAKLGQIKVKLNQNLTKGEDIATIGETGDIFGRVHYKVIKNGEMRDIWDYVPPSNSEKKLSNSFHLPMLNGFDGIAKEYDLKPNNFQKRFHGHMGYEMLVFDRHKVSLVKSSGEIVTKNGTELTDAQKRAILHISEKPITILSIKTVPAHIVEKWDDLKYYKIFIDTKLTDNSEMSRYSATDFAHHTHYTVSKKARNSSIHELRLYTQDYRAKRKAEHRADEKAWRQKTIKHLKEIGLI